ncbi:MAG: hypothetical protein WD845_10960 [Pirellulales bacterium]
MNLRQFAAVVVMLAITGLALHQARSADPPEKDPAQLKQAAGDFATRYAQAQLRLAELRLAKAQEMNRRVARTLAKGVVEQFADDVDFAKAQLAAAQGGGKADSFSFWVRRAELELQDDQEQLRIATSANERVPGAYQPIDLDRMQATIELASLRVERAKELANAPEEAKLVWQLEIIAEELNRVDQMVTLSLQNRLSEFY